MPSCNTYRLTWVSLTLGVGYLFTAAPRRPSSAGSSQKDLDTAIPKELGLPSLERGLLGRENREKESKMAVAKRQRTEKPVKIEQKKVRGLE